MWGSWVRAPSGSQGWFFNHPFFISKHPRFISELSIIQPFTKNSCKFFESIAKRCGNARKRLTSHHGIKNIRTVDSYGASSDILDHFAIVQIEKDERDIDGFSRNIVDWRFLQNKIAPLFTGNNNKKILFCKIFCQFKKML